MRTGLVLAIAITLGCGAGVAAQGRDESTIEGVVSDATGAVLQGATVTLSGSTLIGGSRSVNSDLGGNYRFSALPAGVYELTANAPAFSGVRRGEVQLAANTTATIDLRLQLATVQGTVNVSAPAPIIDVKASAAPVTLDQQMLFNLPNDRSVVDVINLAPGISRHAAFGAGTPGNIALGGTQGSNGLLIDGINVTEPALGGARVTFDYNWIQEIQIVALGAPAEYGRTTGATVDAVLRSGTNRFAGLADSRTTRTGWTADNTPTHTLTPRQILSWWDSGLQLGGPIHRDRLWFFSGFHYYRNADRPFGLTGPDFTSERSARFIAKTTASIRPKLMIESLLEHERHTIDNAELSLFLPTTAAAYRMRQSDVAWNARLRWTTAGRMLDVRTRGYDSPRAFDSMLPGGNSGPAPHYDLATDVGSVNTQKLGHADRKSESIAGSVTQYAEGFLGRSHDFKVGVEYQRGTGRDAGGYPGNRYYLDYASEPYFAYLWDGNVVESTNHETAVYAQDRWAVNARVTLNVGLRFDANRGSVPDTGSVFSTTPISPRLGLAWDVMEDHRTVVRAGYGRYFDPLYGSHYSFRDRRGIHPEILAMVTGPNQFVEIQRNDFSRFRATTDLSQPYAAQTFAGIEREVFPSVSVQAQYIDRRFRDFIGTIDAGSAWRPVDRVDPGPDGLGGTGDDGGALTLYELSNPGSTDVVVTNPPAAFRDYKALQIVGRKRYSQNWQSIASATWSRTNGTVSSAGNQGNAMLDHYDLGWFGAFTDPNHLVNKSAPVKATELKFEGTYHAPWAGGTNLSAIVRVVSGSPWRRTALFRGLGPAETVLVETVSRYLPRQRTLDLRIEKTLHFGPASMGVYVDVFNVANRGAATSVVAASGPRLGDPTGWNDPRTARVGVRAWF